MTPSVAEALALLDMVLPTRTEEQEREARNEQRLRSMGVFIPRMGGVGTETTGCPNCGGTMIRNYEVDDNGNRINVGPYICTSCGAVA